jgi:hypothetical protein
LNFLAARASHKDAARIVLRLLVATINLDRIQGRTTMHSAVLPAAIIGLTLFGQVPPSQREGNAPLVAAPKQVFPPESRNVAGVLDTSAAHMKRPEFKVVRETGDLQRPLRVLDPEGHDIRRFIYKGREKSPSEVVLPNGKYVRDDRGQWNFRDLQGNEGATKMDALAVDSEGNVSFDNPAIFARVALCVDYVTLIRYWHRSSWAEELPWSKVQRTETGLFEQITGPKGKILRQAHYKDGALVRVTNVDKTEWTTADGGKIWTFVEADGKRADYPELDLKIDEKGNVGYTLNGRWIVELADGANMIAPKPDMSPRWIGDPGK